MYAKHWMFNHHTADTLGYREISDACMWSVRVPGLKSWEMFLNWRQPNSPEIWGKEEALPHCCPSWISVFPRLLWEAGKKVLSRKADIFLSTFLKTICENVLQKIITHNLCLDNYKHNSLKVLLINDFCFLWCSCPNLSTFWSDRVRCKQKKNKKPHICHFVIRDLD